MSGDPLIGPLLLQLVLILVNAFFAMTEIAAISINDNKLGKMAEDGNKKAVTLQNLLSDPSRFLSTIQVGITLAGFLGSAFAADNFAARMVSGLQSMGVSIPENILNTICVVLVTLVLSYFTLIFGELVPKRIAQRYYDKIALGVAGLISGISKMTRPIVWLLTASTNAILRLIGIDPNEHEENVTEEEIRMMVDIGGEKGTIDASEREMIDNIFEFNDNTAEDIMTHRTDMVALWVDDPSDIIRNTIVDSGLSRLPVYDEDIDDVIGVLNTRDFLLNLWADPPKPLRDIIRPAYFVPVSVQANVLFRDMQREKIHMAIVVDEYGGTNGIVTMEDLVEEIVGNIYDEYDPAETPVEKLDDETYRLDGGIDLEEVSDLFNIELPVDEFDTLSGLIFSQLSSIPDDGSQPHIVVSGLDVQVEQIEDRRVERALVKKAASTSEKETEEVSIAKESDS